MSNTQEDLKQFGVAQFLQFKFGMYAYPEYIRLFTDMFENRATKEQLDEIETYVQATNNRKKLSNMYDKYQKLFIIKQKL